MLRSVVSTLLISSFAALVPAQNPSDQRLNTNPPGSANTFRPQIAASGADVYAVWQDGRSGVGHDIYFNRSTDGGATWQTADVKLNSRTGSGTKPQIAATSFGVYVVWQDSRDGGADIYFNCSLDAGVTWRSSDVRIDTDIPGRAHSFRPRLSGFSNQVTVCWEDTRNGLFDVYANTSTDGGTTWGTDWRVNTDVAGTASSRSPEVARWKAGVVFTWEDNRNGGSDIYAASSSSGLASKVPVPDVRLSNDFGAAGSARAPRIAASRANFPTICVCWEDQRNGGHDIYANSALGREVTWQSSDVRVDTDAPGAAASRFPEIAVLRSSIYVTWEDARSSVSSIRFNSSVDGGLTWGSSDVQVNHLAPGQVNSLANLPHVAASEGKVFVAWRDSRDGLSDTYVNFSADEGVTWQSADVRLDTDSAGSAISFEHDIAASASSAHVVWRDYRNATGGKADIYANSFTATNTPPVADAGTDLTICPGATVVLQGSGTDADGDPLTFAWSILSQPSASSPVLFPPDVATPGFTSSTSGDYVVSLVVDDGTDPSLPDTITITVQPDLPPVAVATADVVAGTAPLTVNFDGSGSFDPMSPCANAPLTYSWSFGDGNTSTEASPTHTYVLPANYTVSLVVTDSALQTDSETLTISVQLPDFPPTVAPTATPITGPAPLLVTFDAGASDPEGWPLTFAWGFDDPSSPNNSSTAASPTHTYNTPGTYAALVTVSDGTNTVLGNVTVVVEEPIPPLDLDTRSLKIKLRKRGARSKLHMRGMITAGLPDPSAVLRLSADGILVFEAPFSEFVLAGNDADDDDADEAGVDDDVNPSHYKLKRKHLRVELNVSTGRLDVKARRLDLSSRPARNAVVLGMSIDNATAVQCLPVRVRCRGNVLVFRKK